MNRKDFLRMLENELNVLDRVERKEILDFYEERFHTGTNYEGKTEEEIIAELEHPKAIARNVLDEYGVAPRFVKKKEERYDNVDVGQAVIIITFDVLVASWLIPTLFSIAISLFAAVFTWFTTLPLIIGSHTVVDQYIFALLTGSYVLLFFASLAVLEMLIWTSKKLIIWHLNVFKVKKREHFIKKASSFSVDKFFRKHRGLRFFKNIALIGSVLMIAVTGYWVIKNFDVVKNNYTDELISENYDFDFTAAIEADEEWDVDMDLDLYDVNVEYVDSDIMEMTHVYFAKDDFIYNVDEATKEITIYHVDDESALDNLNISIVDLFELVFNQKQSITLYLPQSLKLNDFSIDSSVGDVLIKDVNAKTVTVESNVGTINVQDVAFSTTGIIESDVGLIQITNVTGENLEVSTSVGRIIINDVTVNELDVTADTGGIEISNAIGSGVLSGFSASTSTGSINIDNVDFQTYLITADTGSIGLSSFNIINKDGNSLDVSSDTGSITLTNVFVANVDMETDTGSLYYKNPLDVNFVCTTLEYDTDTGNATVSVGSAN